MSIQLTEMAARHIRKSIVEKRGGVALRLGVRKVGCSGLAYTFDVAREALPYLDGSTLDFVREGFKETFRIENPNAKSTCGCGESFGV